MLEKEISRHKNLLPVDGEVFYFGEVFSTSVSASLLEQLLKEIDWRQDEVKIFGKTYITSRKTAWYADGDLSYTYSGIKRTPHLWSPALLAIRERIEQCTGIRFNACLLNLYHNGDEGMGWHSDDEPELGEMPEIVSVSFGANRRFDFKHKKTAEKISVLLENGSLLWMRGACQTYWKHALPKTKKVKDLRVNLTFRNICQ